VHDRIAHGLPSRVFVYLALCIAAVLGLAISAPGSDEGPPPETGVVSLANLERAAARHGVSLSRPRPGFPLGSVSVATVDGFAGSIAVFADPTAAAVLPDPGVAPGLDSGLDAYPVPDAGISSASPGTGPATPQLSTALQDCNLRYQAGRLPLSTEEGLTAGAYQPDAKDPLLSLVEELCARPGDATLEEVAASVLRARELEFAVSYTGEQQPPHVRVTPALVANDRTRVPQIELRVYRTSGEAEIAARMNAFPYPIVTRGEFAKARRVCNVVPDPFLHLGGDSSRPDGRPIRELQEAVDRTLDDLARSCEDRVS